MPWNTCGAYISGVLGVSTASYLPYCFFNIVNPILSLIYGFTGFHMDRYAPGEVPPDDEVVPPALGETITPQPANPAA